MACSNKNPLKRGGTSRQQRLLNGMKKDYVNIDERRDADWIVFAQEFSAYLNYFDATNQVSGNWKPFFESDISAILGSIAIQSIDEYKLEIKTRFDILKSDNQPPTQKKETLGALFAGILTLSKAIDAITIKLSDDNQLKLTIQNLIRIKLQPALQKLLTYYKGGKTLNLIKDISQPDWKILGLPVIKASGLLVEGLSAIWYKNAASWTDFYTNILKEESIYGDEAADASRKISHAANHNLFKSLFDQFLMAYAKIINDAETALTLSLTSLNNHSPHYTLFLSFLQLFKFSKEHVNSLTQSHLDFYYKEVLRIKPQNAKPDKAHVLIELSKQAETHLLTKGTLLKAGKDSLGKDVFYAIDNDVVFNKAKIAGLMAVYRGIADDNHDSVINKERLFAAPIINSADGLGAEIKTEFKEWHPFINKTIVDGNLKSINMPPAQIGFAIAASHLYLTEGERLVAIKLAPAFSAAQLTALASIECWLTTEKGWYKVESQVWSSGSTSDLKTATILSFTVPEDAPAITNYNNEVHGGIFDCSVPILKVYLKNESSATYKYDLLKNIDISTIEVEVKVGLDANDILNAGGIKNLLLSNDFGVLDPAKPFLPFGPAPKKGASLIIGNQEVFKKKNTSLFFNVEWKDIPEYSLFIDYDELVLESDGYTDLNPKVKAYSLEKGVWKNLSSTDLSILSDFLFNTSAIDVYSATNVTFPKNILSLPEAIIVDYDGAYVQYNITSINGFLKLTLSEGFGHEEYQKQLTKYLIEQAKENPDTSVTEPIAPYTPTIQKISLHYKSYVASSINDASAFNHREIQFFHLYPFGEAEQHAGLNGITNISLLPQFVNESSDVENTGELYVGIENLQAGQSIAVLFQLLEGTSNPLLDKPEKHITWSYLSDNQWKVFNDHSVTDNTQQLLQSGIISFVVPGDATINNTILPPDYIWLRASVTENAEAVCKILWVSAQAALVTYQPANNAADFLNTALPAGSISKLKESTSSIKKITQPYASFGGRPTESNENYYVRVSERLRHKSRAITIWDYEHLILEAFPGIHKVKCLNHTKFTGADYNEIAPGHVTIITIPDLVNRNDANPLRPYTNQNVLEEIEVFLKKKISCHIKLNVRHPQFEEVRLEFKLKLFTGLEFNFYHDLLQQEITTFLTPWAYGNTTDIEFGGKVHKSVLINFIEERSYVDYITDVKMYHRKDETLATESSDTDMIEASTAKSILVSAPSSKHTIYELVETAESVNIEDCVDEYNELKE